MTTFKNLIIDNNNKALTIGTGQETLINSIDEYISENRLEILENRILQLSEWYNVDLDYEFEFGIGRILLVRLFNTEKQFNTGLHTIENCLYMIDGMFCMKSYLNK